MQGLLTALGRGFTKYIGWKRIGVAASLLIIAVAITTLVRTLRGVDAGVILVALTEIPLHRIALAALCVIGAFCTLTFYDFFALRTIGKKQVPYRIAALSSFASYSIGHNIGATVFTGGAIRFRIHSDYGLNAIDVAKICFLSGLTFWLGNTFVLGIGMAWHPWAASAMDQLPPTINRLIAIGALAAIVAYLGWIALGDKRRELGQNGWKVELPSAWLTLAIRARVRALNRYCFFIGASPSLLSVDGTAGSLPSLVSGLDYQMVTRSSGFRYILSPSLTPKAS